MVRKVRPNHPLHLPGRTSRGLEPHAVSSTSLALRPTITGSLASRKRSRYPVFARTIRGEALVTSGLGTGNTLLDGVDVHA